MPYCDLSYGVKNNMIEQVDLLTQKNIIRHIQNKLEKLSDISELVSRTHNDLILESFLPTVISYFVTVHRRDRKEHREYNQWK